MNRSEAGRRGYQKSKAMMVAQSLEIHRRASAKFTSEGKTCLGCGKAIAYEKRRNRFCSHSCSASYSNRKRGYRDRGGSRIACGCGNKPKGQNKYCDCCIEKGKHLPFKPFSELKSEASFRRYLLRTKPNQCNICGRGEWEGRPIPLVMDHINGDPCDHREENLRLICPNCDALLPTYKARNRGRGRVSRRVRYGEGKSY